VRDTPLVKNVKLPKQTIKTSPIDGQRPGTSGLRKKVIVFQEPHYLENFVQSVFDCLGTSGKNCLVVGGDGRYYNSKAIQTIIKMAAANGVGKLIIGKNGLLSTPAVSHLIRKFKADGGIVLSASHNPAGSDGDFGIKFNSETGSAAAEAVTERIHRRTQEITEYYIVESKALDLTTCGEFPVGEMKVQVIDPVQDYAELMQELFDFDKMKSAFANKELSLCFDSMHAVTGPYATEIFENILGAEKGSVINCVPLEDFGGGHPDPSLVHAKQLQAIMNSDEGPLLGAASDGDGDRNLILGKNTFVSPGDSLAVIADHAKRLPQFKAGLKGVARSMPTSTAVDRVAKARDISCYETPTGWKFFGSLLDAERISLCGEESFGTSGDHLREKDGIWAVLCWLSLCVELKKTPAEILVDHWDRYGRSFYCRHDYDNIPDSRANDLMEHLERSLPDLPGHTYAGYTVQKADSFSYTDPASASVTENQGLCILMEGGSRIVFRLSGTGTRNATLRVYLEDYCEDPEQVYRSPLEMTDALGLAAMEIADIRHFTGMEKPTVVT